MKGVRFSVLLVTLSGLLGISLLGYPVSTVANVLSVLVISRLFIRFYLPEGLWNVVMLVTFACIVVWVGGFAERAPAALGLALMVLQLQRIWQCQKAADEKVLILLALLELILVGSQTTSPWFFVAWCGWFVSAPFVLMRGTEISKRLRFWTLTALMLVTTFLFVVLPRFQSPALEPGKTTDAKIGFAEDITLGDLGELIEDDTPVLRVHIPQDVPKPLYFRGVSMDQFNGRGWVRTGEAASPVQTLDSEDTVWVDVLAESGTQGVLFTLGYVHEVKVLQGTVWRDEDENWFVDGPAGSTRYQIRTDFSLPYLAEEEDPRWLQLPQTTSTELIQLGADIVGDAVTSAEKMHRVSDWLKVNTTYTRAPRDSAPEDPIDTFLFETRHGHCEYFASAMALLLRTQGVPTRVVNGFLGGEYNPSGGYWVVRQSHAHAWVEALDERKRWHRLDGTPQEIAPALMTGTVSQWSETVTWWWMNQVVAYDRRIQWQLAETPIWGIQNIFGQGPRSDEGHRFPWVGILICLGAFFGSILVLRRLWLRQRSKWLGEKQRLTGVALCHALAWESVQTGEIKPPKGMPSLLAAEWMAQHAGERGESLRALVWLHYRVQYGGEDDLSLHSEAQRLSQLIQKTDEGMGPVRVS